MIHMKFKQISRFIFSEKKKKKNIYIYTVDCYLEFEGTLWNTSRYPHIDISDLQNLGKNESNRNI